MVLPSRKDWKAKVKPQPITFIWSGREMVPLTRYKAMCEREFKLGEEYALIPHKDRSDASHGHYFAVLSEGWANLPHDLALRFPTAEHLRHWCLVQANFADESIIVAESEDTARAMALLCRTLNPYAVITVSGNILKVYTAQSQSRKTMDHDTFQKSKDAVLGMVSDMIGVTPSKLAANAGRAA